MVEIPKDCVLQWAGHAGYITERFSGLLARQALVDVTLICDEQKLRVHKLVLASNSVYFEEILQQDLGQEPIILLKDLDFEILKAMVEFMYCGETTVSHQYLSSLLDAAKIFKVKELVSVIDTIVGTRRILDNFETCLKQQTGDCNLKVTNSSLTENDYVRVRCDKLSMENASFCADNNNDMCSTKSQSLESDAIDDAEQDSEHTLYDESVVINADSSSKVAGALLPFSMPGESLSFQTDLNICVSGIVNEVQTMGCTRGNRDEIYCNNSHHFKPMLYEQCYDLIEVSEHEQTSSSDSSCSTTLMTATSSNYPRIDDNPRYLFDRGSVDLFNQVGKCIKVYTHKRRKSVDELRNKLVHTQCNLVPATPPSTDSIDLTDEPSANDVPVTLLTSLDMESDDYILSLSTESIQSIVGSTISDQHTVIGCKKLHTKMDEKEEERGSSLSDVDYTKPVLRRSTRLNQQESDEVMNNGGGIPPAGSIMAIERPFKKGNSPNRMESYAKAKRKGREDRKVPDHSDRSVNTTLQSVMKRSLKSKKSNSKLIVRKNHSRSTCTVTGTVSAGREKEESKPKATTTTTTTDAIRGEDTEGWVTSTRSCVSPIKFDTISGINRALWGDRSDTWSDEENEMDLPVYSPDNAIPFAVGLLPLRTALEKMQATPDYQPRKTRSSFAPLRQDSNLKRKANCVLHHDIAKKQHLVGNHAESPKTVCHIQIKAAPSQDVKNRKSRLLTAATGDGRREQAITQTLSVLSHIFRTPTVKISEICRAIRGSSMIS